MRIQLVSLAGHTPLYPPKSLTFSLRVSLPTFSGWVLQQLSTDSHSQEVTCRMQTGWIPWGLESLSPALIVSDVSSDTSWVSTSPLLLGVIKCLDLWMCSCVLCRQGIKDVRTLKKKKNPGKKRETKKQNEWQRWRRKSSRNRNNCLETGGQMPSKPERQTAVAERQHAPCCSWAVIISYLGTKPRQTSYYQYSTARRWSPKQLMPFEISGPTTMSTDFKQSVCGKGGIRTFSLHKKGGRGNLLMSRTSMNCKRARTCTQGVTIDHIFSTSNPYS